jgi:DNA-binding cell septation regulator SpoVG
MIARQDNVQAIRPEGGIVATKLRRIDKGALVGFVDLRIEGWGLILNDCKWFRTNKAEWIGMPSAKFTTRDGKTTYKDIIEFTDKAIEDRFLAAALRAVLKLV